MPPINPAQIDANGRLTRTVLSALKTQLGEDTATRLVRHAYTLAVEAANDGRDYHAKLDNALRDLVNEYDIRLCECGDDDCNRPQDIVTDDERGISEDCAEAQWARFQSTAD